MKPRSDSLYAKLTPEQREEVLFWLLIEGKSLVDVGGTLADNGVQTSVGAISNFLQTHGLPWRVQRAKGTAEAMNQMDLGNITQDARQGIQKQLYEAAFRELSVKEMAMLQKLDLEERKLEVKIQEVRLAMDKFQWEAASRVLRAVKEKPELLRELVGNAALTEEQRIGRLIGALWGEEKAA